MPNEDEHVARYFVRFAGLFRGQRHEAEMNDQLRAHLEALIDRNIAAGMSRDEARFAALRTFGGVEQVKERAREERRSIWVEQLGQDLRYAARQLRKTPAFTAVAIVSLALGAITVFCLVNEVLLKTLAVKKPEAVGSW